MSKYDALHPAKTLKEYVHSLQDTGRWSDAEAQQLADRIRSRIPKGNQTEAMQRKGIPVATGFVDYFPLAIQEVAKVSKAGHEQHKIEGPLRWARELSADEADAMLRHFIDRGKLDSDGLRHSAKMAWRAMAYLQKELERELEHDTT